MNVCVGISQGFRYSNGWLAAMTDGVFPANFYSGDAVGSSSGWARLLTGLPFARGGVWLLSPRLESGSQ